MLNGNKAGTFTRLTRQDLKQEQRKKVYAIRGLSWEALDRPMASQSGPKQAMWAKARPRQPLTHLGQHEDQHAR